MGIEAGERALRAIGIAGIGLLLFLLLTGCRKSEVPTGSGAPSTSTPQAESAGIPGARSSTYVVPQAESL